MAVFSGPLFSPRRSTQRSPLRRICSKLQSVLSAAHRSLLRSAPHPSEMRCVQHSLHLYGLLLAGPAGQQDGSICAASIMLFVRHFTPREPHFCSSIVQMYKAFAWLLCVARAARSRLCNALSWARGPAQKLRAEEAALGVKIQPDAKKVQPTRAWPRFAAVGASARTCCLRCSAGPGQCPRLVAAALYWRRPLLCPAVFMLMRLRR